MSGAVAGLLLGAGVVSAAYAVTLLLARATAGVPGPVAAPLLAASYVLKVLAMGWILLTVPAPAGPAPGWCAAGALVALTCWLAVAAGAAARRTRAAAQELRAARRRPGAVPDDDGGPHP